MIVWRGVLAVLCFAVPVFSAEMSSPKVLLPNFKVKKLSVDITNPNNVIYSPDGRLFVAGYDSRVHLLKDTDGDGLEDKVITFDEEVSNDYPLGVAWYKDSLYVLKSFSILCYQDTNNDGVPDKKFKAVEGWNKDLPLREKMKHRRVDKGIGLAIDKDGNFFIGIGTANYSNAYMDGDYRRDIQRGCVLKISNDGSKQEIIATGVRYTVGMAFDKKGNLFATDQEGATWLPNGNPFDELLHIQEGKHYGFPPSHPKLLPGVIDEPSLYDYGPQHQSTCGLAINGSRDGFKTFGPQNWESNIFVTGYSRGNIYRTVLTPHKDSFTAKSEQFINFGLQGLPVDCEFSPKGELIIACHSGKPDWGTGPKGKGSLYKIVYEKSRSMPLEAVPVSPVETHIVFDSRLDASSFNLKDLKLLGSPVRMPADDLPQQSLSYKVVKMQKMAATNFKINKISVKDKTLILHHEERRKAINYSIHCKDYFDLGMNLNGQQDTEGLASGNKSYEVRTQLDLWKLLYPKVQPGSQLDYEEPYEQVTLHIATDKNVEVFSNGKKLKAINETTHLLEVEVKKDEWIPIKITAKKALGKLSFSYFTNRDKTLRPLQPSRLFMPWAVQARDPYSQSSKGKEVSKESYDLGKSLFYGKAACYLCHQMNQKGGKIGPDLSNSFLRDYEVVLNDILKPSQIINPDAIAYEINLKNKSLLIGVVQDENEDSLTLGLISGTSFTVKKEEILQRKIFNKSLMPEGLLNNLSSKEKEALMDYLMSAPEKNEK